MVKLNRINGKDIILNSELIEIVESTPDTIITLVNGTKYIVLETPEEIVDKIIDFKAKIHKRAANDITK